MSQKPKLPIAWQLLRSALQQFLSYWKVLIPIVALVAVPVGIITATQGKDPDAGVTAYTSIANLVMYLSLIWAVDKTYRGESISLSQAYYRGSAALVKFILVAIVLTLELLPLAFGAYIYLLGSVNTVASTGEKILLGIVWLILALPSLYLLCRTVFALYIVQDEDIRPLQAIRLSFSRIKGRTLAVAQRLIVLGLVSIIILALPLLTLLGRGNLNQPPPLYIALQLIIYILFLPISTTYLYRLHKALE